jgi:hypothetical protein
MCLVLCICFTRAKSSIFIVTEDLVALWHTAEMIKLDVEASADAEVNMCGSL